MTALVLGAGGIIGQYMLLERPNEVYVRRQESLGYVGADLSDRNQVTDLLWEYQPEVIINLAGENRLDVVQGCPDVSRGINVGLPTWLAEWCHNNDAHLVQVSSQAVFDGDRGPYGPSSRVSPVTEYGAQKAAAEKEVMRYRNWTIARVTFVLGVRPFGFGRVNPLEQMFALDEQKQVDDRWFSVSFAKDVAKDLWDIADRRQQEILHLGIPERYCRYDIAKLANKSCVLYPVSDNEFAGVRRPYDTTWARGSIYRMSLKGGIDDAYELWRMLNERPAA